LHQVLDRFDEIAQEALRQSAAEVFLIERYFEFWHALKKRVGTAANFTGLSELLFFRYLLFALKAKGEDFCAVPSGSSGGTAYRGQSLLLTHDADISAHADVPRMRTDIAIFTADSRKLVAAFEVKIYLSDRSVLDDLKLRFERLASSGSLLLAVLFEPQYQKELDAFCAEHPDQAFVLSKAGFTHRIGLSQVVDRIATHITLPS